ncbi:MarR family transcriptional regulator [Caproiciproducens sp. NJN-50]|uniref:MarR family winged helix-turn-helix transcriptional regulator n=1 Tax=Acutalibacteraceae TaxID=3082771 RepID=UPI000FFDFC6A|nr:MULTISPECIES: MarR family transcriptional regulator [Acutalibacteraceae]QAT48838.1 MarR family transcriptional regulator [Caproiciproducens sp. NJN-50]
MHKGVSSIGKWISVLYRCRKSFAGRTLEPCGIAGCQYLFLLTLNCEDGASQEKISDDLKIDKTTTAKSIKVLEKNGFVTRVTDPGDRRAYQVFLTQKAKEILPRIQEAMAQWDEFIQADLTEEERRLLEGVLAKMAAKAYQSEYHRNSAASRCRGKSK